jgi:hypothetical protein
MTEQYDLKPDAESAVDPDIEPEYDFSNGVRGMFANARFPILIHNSILGYFHRQAVVKGTSSEQLINEVLRHHVAAMGYLPPALEERR